MSSPIRSHTCTPGRWKIHTGSSSKIETLCHSSGRDVFFCCAFFPFVIEVAQSYFLLLLNVENFPTCAWEYQFLKRLATQGKLIGPSFSGGVHNITWPHWATRYESG